MVTMYENPHVIVTYMNKHRVVMQQLENCIDHLPSVYYSILIIQLKIYTHFNEDKFTFS